jgi:hypothetical protein
VITIANRFDSESEDRARFAPTKLQGGEKETLDRDSGASFQPNVVAMIDHFDHIELMQASNRWNPKL